MKVIFPPVFIYIAQLRDSSGRAQGNLYVRPHLPWAAL